MADGEHAANARGAGAQLIQSRRISVDEALAIFRADIAGYRRQLATRPSYRLGSLASHLVLPLACIMPVAGIELQWFAHVSPYLIAAVGCLVVIGARRAWRDYCHRLYAKICHDACKSDRRLRIEESGIVATESGVASSISWTAISDISVVLSGDSLLPAEGRFRKPGCRRLLRGTGTALEPGESWWHRRGNRMTRVSP